MSRKAIVISAAVAAIVGIGLGVIIGYFSHPSGASSSPNQEWVGKVESFFDDLDELVVEDFVSRIEADNIRENLMYFADEPHMATSPRDEELAAFIRDTWRGQLDEAYLTPFEVMHGFLSEDPDRPNTASVVDENNATQYELGMTEVVYEEHMKSPETIVPYFSAYGPPGDVQGKLVFANYGSDDDYASLAALGVSVNDTIALVKYGGGVGRGGKARVGQKYGVKGVLVYSDPAEWVVDGEEGYPVDWSLPGTGVQRGSTLLRDFGDPSTPFYPSTNSSYRLPMDEIEQFPPIPLQPIGYDDAALLLRDLSGPAAPTDWTTGLDIGELHVGPGFSAPNNTYEVHLVTNNIYKTTTTYNVIGVLRGKEEPDKYVMYGNHRDSWVYGAVDPGSGTACMMEITRVLAGLVEGGWRPRRTILFASWGSEEFGLMGSTEWIEENLQLLTERALLYINVDIAVFANQSFFARASPLVSRILFDATEKIQDNAGSSRTLKEIWESTFPNEEGNNPLVGRLYTSSDYAAFYQSHGITSADLSFRGDPDADARYKISPYPTYHSAYDTFDYVERFVDPGFLAHQNVARIAGSSLIIASDSLLIPFSLDRFNDFLQSQIAVTEREFATQLSGQGITLDYLKAAGEGFEKAVNDLQAYIDSRLDRKDPKDINAVNRRILGLERCFIEPKGLPGQPSLRHVSGSPGSLDDSTGSFPGLQDALYRIEEDDQERWEVVKQQLALATYKINSAAKWLEMPASG